jgi:PhoPQ-activated pathogenicity-related protein
MLAGVIRSMLLIVVTFLGAMGCVPVGKRVGVSESGFRSPPTALDRYVAAPDPAFVWKTVLTTNVGGARLTIIDLVSQTWLTTNEVNRTEWRHWLTVVRPEQVTHDTALLFIGGGRNEPKPPRPNGDLLAVARATESIVAELRMVPNQPLIFGGDGQERVEDDLIAYTWDTFLRTGDERWPARLPMTKAAVRAMDTVMAFCRSEDGGGIGVTRFVVAGGSKRGWTTWTTAAVDPRVVALCPIVIDMLNVEPSFRHHFQAYGFYAPAVDDYVRHGIMSWQGTPEYRALMRIEEPFEYRDRLTQPKLLLNACGDQFFLPDSWQFYFHELRGTNFLRYVPNADHSLKGSDAYETLLAWHHAVINGRPLPRFVWQRTTDGRLRVTATDRPQAIKLWQATNPIARDFRLETLGPVWRETELTLGPDGACDVVLEAPARGWTASMVELTYDLGGPKPLKVTTGVYVTPDTLPHPAPEPVRAAVR